ncbi:hypothetical protein Golob_011073 [Gossypium lobatum]|uniref:RNase H type-1 domain-containing protein n=1 Tax=Gossypium lobatum TaxID=34289 RepID=A0A7J8MNC1_9ROSI|nr:hypothetical protein [Gossypium lobatum]
MRIVLANQRPLFFSNSLLDWIETKLCSSVWMSSVDGNSFSTTKGVIWKRNGEWILGYNHYLGSCSIFEVEIWGILDGLAIIHIMGYKNVLIHTDRLEVVKAL